MIKVCPRCGISKPVSQFSESRKNRMRLGRFSYCKSCRRAKYQELKSTPKITVASKQCRSCLLVKDAHDFVPHAEYKDGLTNICRKCTTEKAAQRRAENRDKYRESASKASQKWRQANRDVAKNTNLLWYYSITLEQFNAILREQDYKCAVCGTANPNRNQWVVDHDHSCCAGKKSCGRCVRGILCQFCNRALGQIRDNRSAVIKLLQYLDNPPARSIIPFDNRDLPQTPSDDRMQSIA